MSPKIKKIIMLIVILVSLAIIITIAILKSMDDNIALPPNLTQTTTEPAVIDENLVGKWKTRNLLEVYGGDCVFSILEFHFNSDGSLVVYQVGYQIDLDKDSFVQKGTEWVIDNHTSTEIDEVLQENGCASIAELVSLEYDAYIEDATTEICFMGYWKAENNLLYNWGQGYTIESSAAEPYSINGDILTVGNVEYTRIVYAQAQ